tara:strand:- start:504 stop:1025 length:522 start_codon:yes stop_codon:yes gene_type:complete
MVQNQQLPSSDKITYQEFKNKMVSISNLSSNDVHYQQMMNTLENIKYITYPDGSEKRVNVKEALKSAHANFRGDSERLDADQLIKDHEIVYNNIITPTNDNNDNVVRRLEFGGGNLSKEVGKNKKKYKKHNTIKKRNTNKRRKTINNRKTNKKRNSKKKRKTNKKRNTNNKRK